jgi:hypothetical protein
MHAPTRALLRAAIGSPCAYCGEPMQFPTRDHIRPRAKGGTFAEPGNAAIACEPCNLDKGARSLMGWLVKLIEAGDAKRAACVAAFMAGRNLPPALPPEPIKILPVPCSDCAAIRGQERGQVR